MAANAQPLVSCIMPTADRSHFVPQAIDYFLRQHYANRELVIVDDGRIAVAHLVPGDARIRYERLEGHSTVGHKRNAACRLAQGELIAHWDDDDWHAPWRLSYQIGQLLGSSADLCGSDMLLYWELSSRRAWHYVYPRREAGCWVAGGTLCYRRTLWEAQPFADIDNGEDTRFVRQAGGRRTLVLPRDDYYLALLHGRNTGARRGGSSRWREADAELARRRLGSDWAFYRQLRESVGLQRATNVAAGSQSSGARRGNRLPFDGWSISPGLADELSRRLAARPPLRILEVGSGVSTVILAEFARGSGAEVVSLEHDGGFFARTERLLRDAGLEGLADVRLAPLEAVSTPAGEQFTWYRTQLDGQFDFVLIDGPPAKHGRQASLFALHDRLRDNAEIWLKDAHRGHERLCLDLWKRHFEFDCRVSSVDPRGLAVLKRIRPRAALQSIEASPPAASAPRVSCIMPTCNRRRFASQAIEYFRRQDYPHRELIIVDDGNEPLEDLGGDHASVRVIQLASRHSIGAKRNLACQAARGKFVVCWDDDDWHGAARLSYQLQPLLEDRADVTGLIRSVLFDLDQWQFWNCRPSLSGRMFYKELLCGTIAFRRDLWQRGARFPDQSQCEDVAMLRALTARGGRLERLPGGNCYIYVRHGHNSWRFRSGQHLDACGWEAVAQPPFLSLDDLAFYKAVREPSPQQEPCRHD